MDHAFRAPATTKAATGVGGNVGRSSCWHRARRAPSAPALPGFTAKRDAAVRNPERRRRAAQIFLDRYPAPPRSTLRVPPLPLAGHNADLRDTGRNPGGPWCAPIVGLAARRSFLTCNSLHEVDLRASVWDGPSPHSLDGGHWRDGDASGQATASRRRWYSIRWGLTAPTTPVPSGGTRSTPSSWSAQPAFRTSLTCIGSAGTASSTNSGRSAAWVANVHGFDFFARKERRREEIRTEIVPTVVHLDTKPGNFIFTSGDTMKLRDFNLAYFLEASVATGTCGHEEAGLQHHECSKEVLESSVVGLVDIFLRSLIRLAPFPSTLQQVPVAGRIHGIHRLKKG
eukprot:CAMPEP_0194309700 /NCGR_PEP_ID=MMETSP0171-20130528/6676_1 /TAXON_ID=218684 /ORGANISM="Corethron pennatum, Strain L29A3" /LENGTH=340 /DNA_ID=CAMNT_0039062993 /DNA_START=86 /DNA_END=1111 /DNA_ORIENTATION=+